MYIYFGYMHYKPYAIYEPFYLVIETEFKFGAPVRAFWQWTVDANGNKNVDKLSLGMIDCAEATDSPTTGTTYGVFYDLYYPFDIFIGDDDSKIALTVWSRTSSSLRRFNRRTTAPDYDPVIALPNIRYYGLGSLYGNLFAMIVPENLCQDSLIWVACEDDTSIYYWYSRMTAVGQTDSTLTVTLVKEASADMSVRIERPSSHASVLSSRRTHTDANAIDSKPRASPSALAHQDMQLKAGQRSQYGYEVGELSLRTLTTGTNDAGADGQAVLCRLQESGSSVKGKVLAGAGMGLAALGMVPLGGFSTPVAVYGLLLAGVGLYDAFNDGSGEVEQLLFPDDRMERRTSAGIPIGDDNDLIVTYAEIKDKVLSFRVGMKEKTGTTTISLKEVLNEKDLFKTMLEISWPDFEGKAIQACKFVKVKNLVPYFSPGQTLASLSDATFYNLADGQIISDAGGKEKLYDTLSATPSSWTNTVQLQSIQHECYIGPRVRKKLNPHTLSLSPEQISS
ncbi:hypothetical protein AJ80_03389 [Polytolypa hystricis UAMH7299]|uniref:Uncharacterized protein n=1 Tax=Polytolypa hystricis (strain UAMH7299) TaxID=1447883 RepID=A0A2B7YKH7_POLH7|nr:hypothetical protein AJ80_03389 [Polytolypa hystricis UAMH7299]